MSFKWNHKTNARRAAEEAFERERLRRRQLLRAAYLRRRGQPWVRREGVGQLLINADARNLHLIPEVYC